MFSVKMKVVGLVVCLMCVPISASFYDELQGAMHSVQHGFGKLLSDVVIDVTDTVHCTISAVEHVLTLNGLIRSKSAYGHKCRDGPLPPIEIGPSDGNDPLQNFLRTREAIEEGTYGGATHTQLHASIANVNRTLSHALDNQVSQRKINSISKVLKDETEQLTKVSNILRQELNSISKNVNSKLQDFEHDLGTSVWAEIEMERNNPVLDKIHQSETTAQQQDKDNIDDKRGIDEQNSFDNAILDFERLRDDVTKNDSNKHPKNFRDVARNIRDQNYNEDPKEPKIVTGSVFNVNGGNFDQFSPFYDPASRNDESHKHALAEMASIIKDGEHTQQVMDKLFTQSHAAEDVFAINPGIFNF